MEGKVSNVGGHPFVMVMREHFLWSSSFSMVVVWGR